MLKIASLPMGLWFTLVGLTKIVLLGIGSWLMFAVNRIRYGAAYTERRRHRRPACLDGWDSRHLQLDSVRLHYVQTGSDDKPLMLFIHGFPEFWYSWRYQLRHFENDYRCVAIDQRGYNESEKPEGVAAYTIPLLASDVKQVINKLGYEKAIVVGHDWGAVVAWHTALMFPDVVDKLIICNVPHPGVFSHLLQTNKQQASHSWYVYMFQNAVIPEKLVAANDFEMFEKMFRGKKAGLRNREKFTDDDLEAWKYSFSAEGALTPPINYYRAAIRHPRVVTRQDIVEPETLIIWGEDDAFLVKEGAGLSLESCRKAQLVSLPGISHWVMQDAPEKVNEAMEAFLTGTVRHKL